MPRINRRRASICTMASFRLATRGELSSCPCQRGRDRASGIRLRVRPRRRRQSLNTNLSPSIKGFGLVAGVSFALDHARFELEACGCVADGCWAYAIPARQTLANAANPGQYPQFPIVSEG